MARFWLVAVVLMLACAAALGQQAVFMGGGGGYDPNAPPATVEEVDRLAKDAGLDDGARASLRALVEGFDEALQVQARRQQRMWERMYLTSPPRDPNDPEAYRELYQKEAEKHQAEHDRISKTLIIDLRALVPADKDEAWAAFERRRNRRMYLGMSSRTGVGVDLVLVAERRKIADLPAIRDILDPYERTLDRLLLARVPAAKENEEKMAEAQQKGDTAAVERMFSTLRDADCTILHLQRETARKVLEAAPKEKLGELRDLLLTGRSPYIQTKPPVRLRAERIVKGKRVAGANKEALEQAIRSFDDRSRAVDEKGLTDSEDRECTQTYAESVQGDSGAAMRQWYEDSRKLQAELLLVLERVATEEDLDWADRQGPEPAPGEDPPVEKP